MKGKKKPNKIEKYRRSRYLRKVRRKDTTVFFHSLLGNPLELDSEEVKVLENYKVPRERDESDLLERLVDASFLVPEGTDERDALKEAVKERKENFKSGTYVRNLQLNISEDCNFECTYCIQGRDEGDNDRAHEKVKNMPWEVARESVDKFMDLLRKNEHQKGHIMFFGGEPLMNWSTVSRTLEYIAENYSDMDITTLMTTNGSLITPEVARTLKEHGVKVQISVDGLKETNDRNRVKRTEQGLEGTFDDIDRGIENLQEAGVPASLGVVITEEFFDLITEEFIDYAVSRGIRNIEVNPEEKLHKIIKPKKVTEKLLDLIDYGRNQGVNVFSLLEVPLLNMIYNRSPACSASGGTLSVEPSGDIYLCRCMGHKIGSIEDIEGVLQNDHFAEMSTRMSGSTYGCDGCYVEGLCGGGCSANAETATGDAMRGDPSRCQMIRNITREEIKKYGVPELTEKAKEFTEFQFGTEEPVIESALTKSDLNFWEKESVRKELGVEGEREYIPVRLIGY